MIDSKTKKIVDAVNYFEGSVVSQYNYDVVCVNRFGCYDFCKEECFSLGDYNTERICTFEEFNQCVKEMSAAAWMMPKAPINPTYEKVIFKQLWQVIKAVEDDTDTYYFKHKSIYIELDDTDVATAVFKTKQYEFYKLVDELEQKAIAEYEKFCLLLDMIPDWNGRSLNVKANYYAMVEKNVTVTRK